MVFKTVASSSKTVVDLTDAYTVSLSNESVSIACDVAGTAVAGELGAGGKATAVLSVYKGTIALTAVGSGVTPAVGQYKYIIGTTTGSTVARSNDSTFYIATLLADAGSVPVTIYLEGNTTTVTKTLTWNKSKTGATGKAIVSIVEEYYYSTSSSTQSDSSWGIVVPAWVNGRYLWTRTRTVFSSGPDSLTNPVCITGQKGTDGTIYYTWVKYADNADGTIGMADTPAGKRYIGISVNQTSSTESTTPTFYTWSPLYDNVVVGGTNLWLDSSPEKSLANWNVGDGTKTLDATMLWEGKPTIKFVKASVTAGGLNNNAVRSGLPASTQFAYSFMVRSSVSMPLNANSMGHMQVLGTSDGGANNHRETAITYSPTTIPANVWTKATIVFSTPAEAIAGETFTFRSFLYYLTYGATYYFSDFQLEKGNISSDWTPAPEDVSAQIETKSKTFTSQPANYAVGDIWKENATIKIAVTDGTTYNAAHWTLVGDVTSANTAADVTSVNGTAAATIAAGAANGTTANNAVTAGSTIWGRASNINSDGTINTSKLSGTVTDAQIASGTAWNTAKTLVTDITTNTTLTPFEKQTLKPEYDTILKEKLQATALATSYGVLTQTYYTDYIAAYDALYAGMNTIMTTNIAVNSTIVRATVQGWFSNYYDKSAAFQNGINIQAKTLAGAAATAAATAASLAQAMTQGKMLNKDPAFALNVNGTSVYRTGTWSRVTSATDSMAPPTTSGYMMKLVVTGAPGQGGGFTFGTSARANAKFIVNILANAPVGTTINFASNAIGTGATTSWLTSNVGTGKWTEYTYSVVCGATGTFADTNYFYFENATYPFNVYIAMATVYDTTTFESFASQINSDPSTITIDGAKLHFTTDVSMDNTWIDKLVANSIVTNKIQATDIAAGRITSGSISADRIAANSLSGDKIIANTIDATRLKIGSGAQGGYINNPRFTSWASTYPDGTSLWSAGGISKVTVDTVPMAQFAPAAGAQQGMTLDSSYFANGIDLDGMQYFALECRFRLTSGTNPAGASLLVDIYRQDNSYERMQLDMKEVGATVTANTWYVARKVFKLTDANVAKTFKSIGGYLLANFSGAGDAAKTIQFASVNMFQASAQEFLAQSWTNGGTTSINGGFIATGTLSADKITTGALNASLITTGALNASLITTGNLDAARITAGVISAGNGKSTINMSTGAFSFGSGKIDFDGTTLSLNVDSLKITNSSVATEVYASLAAGTAKTEAISAAATDATSKVNGIEIGGRNLAMNSHVLNNLYSPLGGYVGTKTFVADTEALSKQHIALTCTTAGTGYHFPVFGKTADKVGNTYTWSFYAKCSVAKSGSVGHESGGSKTISLTTSWQKFTHTFTYSDSANSSFTFYLNFLVGETLYIRDFKIEKGNKATEWTPAPEDVTAQIETKSKTFTSTPTNYAIGDIWKDAATVKIATTASAAYNAAHWTLVGDVTSANTANDVSYVNGTSASTVKTQAAAGNTAQNTLTTKSGAWDTASTDASAAKTAIADMSSDSKVTPVEKVQLKKEWATVEAERTSLDGMAATFGITTERTNMTNAYNALNAVLNSTTGTTNGVTNGILSNMTSTTTLTGANFRAIFDDYYDKKAILQRKASEEAKQQAVTHANTQVNGIEIGGRNTFKKTTAIAAIAGTNTTTKNSLNGMSIVSTVAGIARMSNVINENGFWTFSAWVTSTAPSTLAIDFCDMPTQNFAVSTTRTKITMTSNVTNYTSAIYHFIDIAGLIAATYTFEDVKVEKGNKATSWTPAPEDVAYDIEQKADSAEVAGNLNIVSTAAAQAKSIADAKLNKNTYDDFVKEYGEYKTALAVDQSVAAGNLQAAQTAVASIKKEMGDMKESWMFNNGTKIEATPNGMLISDGNPSGMNMLLSQNRLSFFDGGVEVAYIADKTMKINNGIFVKSARIGSHLISTSPVNSDITIVSFVGEG